MENNYENQKICIARVLSFESIVAYIIAAGALLCRDQPDDRLIDTSMSHHRCSV
jgi:hypothetical protein